MIPLYNIFYERKVKINRRVLNSSLTTSAMGACLSSPKGDDVSASSARTFVGASAKRAGAGDGSAALVDVPLDSPRAEKGTPAPNPEAGANASSTGVEEEAIAVDEVNPFVDCVRGIDGEMLAGMMEAVASVARHDALTATVSTRVDADEDEEIRSEPDTLPDDEPEVNLSLSDSDHDAEEEEETRRREEMAEEARRIQEEEARRREEEAAREARKREEEARRLEEEAAAAAAAAVEPPPPSLSPSLSPSPSPSPSL